MMAATRVGSMSHLNSCSMAFLVSSSEAQWHGKGTWYTSGANGPKPALYGCTLPVRPTANRLRPWKAAPNAITPPRPVAWRAILMAFSTASAPVEKNAVLAGPLMGTMALMRSASVTYSAYGTTW